VRQIGKSGRLSLEPAKCHRDFRVAEFDAARPLLRPRSAANLKFGRAPAGVRAIRARSPECAFDEHRAARFTEVWHFSTIHPPRIRARENSPTPTVLGGEAAQHFSAPPPSADQQIGRRRVSVRRSPPKCRFEPRSAPRPGQNWAPLGIGRAYPAIALVPVASYTVGPVMAANCRKATFPIQQVSAVATGAASPGACARAEAQIVFRLRLLRVAARRSSPVQRARAR